MNALSLSKSKPRNSQGNRLCTFFIASTTSEPSRVTSGRHSVQPVAMSTIVSVWMNEPATDVPPWATMSTCDAFLALADGLLAGNRHVGHRKERLRHRDGERDA